MSANRARAKHGMRNSPEYKIWRGMKDRCFNPNSPYFADYGGRGISIAPEWRDDFAAFFKAVGSRPNKKYSIDRWPNNDGNYEPGNVRWATRENQMRNTRLNHVVEINGRSQTVIEWAHEYRVPAGRVYQRLYRGWEPLRALMQPQRRMGKS